MIALEVCAEGLSAAIAAGDGGADRVELCSWRGGGGVTPSIGAIEVACQRLAIPVHVLIRPRAGDFVYDLTELEEMRRDVAATRAAGASGVVLGVLQENGEIDARATARLVAEARPMSVTFHKAIDATPDLAAGLATLIELGIDRVLTSGGAATAREGIAQLERLVTLAAGRIVVMAGGSITRGDVPRLLAAGLTELHIGSAACINDKTAADAVSAFLRALRHHEASA